MDQLPRLAVGYVRIALHLRDRSTATPGDIARATGLPAEDLGPIALTGDGEAILDVRAECGRQAREGLHQIGRTQLLERNWQWLRLAIGRNHGLSMGQLRRIMQTADALPLGRISINNTHTLVGLQDDKLPHVIERLAGKKINGYHAKPEALPPGAGPGPAAFVPHKPA